MEYDKELIAQQWDERQAREEQRLRILKGLLATRKAALEDLADGTVEFWEMQLTVFDTETVVKSAEHYIESLKKDRQQQELFISKKREFIEAKATDILAKARRSIDSNSDRKPVLEVLLKDMPEPETPKWYERLWSINEHVNVAKVPTTMPSQLIKLS